MNDNNNSVKTNTSEAWLASIKAIAETKKFGRCIANDKNGSPVIIEWHMVTSILSPELAAFKKKVSDLGAQVTGAVEVELLQNYPDAVHSDGFLKACEPLFAQGPEMVNWQLVKETLQATIRQFYLMDISKFGPEVINKLIDDIFIFASIKDQKTNALLGFAMSSITPALPYGDLKVINVVIAPEAQMRELERLLLGTIFKIIPSIKRMFSIIRPTDKVALAAYKACGFTPDCDPVNDPNHTIAMEHLVAFEYKAEQSNILQKTAATLVE